MKKIQLGLFFLISVAVGAAHAENFFVGLAGSITSTFHQVTAAPSPSPASSAQTAKEDNLGITSSDSSYLLVVNVPTDTRLLHIQIKFEGSQLPDEVADFEISAGGHIEKKIYFLHGAGKYTVIVFYSSDPNRFQAGQGFKYLNTTAISNTDTRDESFLLPSADAESDDPAIFAQAQSLINASMDDMAKAKALHDWVSSTIAYDAASYFDGSYATKVYDASGAFQSHVSICFGYSNLYAALARSIGMRTKVINGAIIWPELGQSWDVQKQTQVHAWNEILVGNRWVTVDTTWDSGNMDFTTKKFTQALHEDYFDPAPDKFAINHQKISDNVND